MIDARVERLQTFSVEFIVHMCLFMLIANWMYHVMLCRFFLTCCVECVVQRVPWFVNVEVLA